jgi:hypothetical protein
MTRPLSQQLREHKDWRHAITDPCLRTFAVCSEILPLWRFQDILACGTMNRLLAILPVMYSWIRCGALVGFSLRLPIQAPFPGNSLALLPGVAPFTASIGTQPLSTAWILKLTVLRTNRQRPRKFI